MVDWIYGVWFCGDGWNKDWMCRLFKSGGHWEFEYRFRYYSGSGKAFDSGDKKNWYRLRSSEPGDRHRDRLADGIRAILPAIEAQMGTKADFVLLDCEPNDPKVIFELGSRPWCHLKKVPK